MINVMTINVAIHVIKFTLNSYKFKLIMLNS